MIEQPGLDFFTVGGTLLPDAPSYVMRPTDDELFHRILNGELCYVLTPRQMGKSSLMVRTAQRLQNEGIRSAIVDLTVTGTGESEDQWYKGILTQVKSRLRINIDLVHWWEQRKDIPNVQKFVGFFEEVLTEVKEHVVIFIDEIDTTLKLDFRDDFFAGIRAIFNARSRNPDLKRLTFVLLGVASPSDLIKNPEMTPFNIGQEVLLKPFNRENASMLETGLEVLYPGSGKKILDRIFHWTNGHPYLTQKLCQSVVEARLDNYDDQEIDLLVENLFTSAEASRETNLQFVRDNVLNYPKRRVILSLYKKLLRGIEVRDNKNSLPQNHLKLSGLARAETGKLVVSNKIYSKVFNLSWANKHTELNWPVITTSILGVIVVALLSILYYDGKVLPDRAGSDITMVTAYQDNRGIEALADLFQLDPIISSDEYSYKAKDTFFNTFRWEEQKALVEITYEEKQKTQSEKFGIVVAGLYTSLADIDNSGQTTELLDLMYKSLKEMGMQNEGIYQEIGYWLGAKKDASENRFDDALAKYSSAIGLSPQNPATLFERARIYALRGDYENALKDYEQVIAIASKSIEPVETPEVSISQTPPALTPFLTLTPAQSFIFTPNETASLSPISTVTPLATPTSTTDRSPIQPKFLTRGQVISAVKTDLDKNNVLSSFYSHAKLEDYSSLATNVPTLEPPINAVVDYLIALVAKDVEGLTRLVCGDWEDDALLELDSFQAVTTRLEGLSCEQTGTDGDIALVLCHGAIIAIYNDENQALDLSLRTYQVIQEGGDWLVCGTR